MPLWLPCFYGLVIQSTKSLHFFICFSPIPHVAGVIRPFGFIFFGVSRTLHLELASKCSFH